MLDDQIDLGAYWVSRCPTMACAGRFNIIAF